MTSDLSPRTSFDIGIDSTHIRHSESYAFCRKPPYVNLLSQMVGEIISRLDNLDHLSLDFKETINRSRLAMSKILSPFGVSVPEIRNFSQAGIDFKSLEEAYMVMTKYHLEPECVFVPNLPLDTWNQVYLNFQDNPDDRDDFTKNDNLWIDEVLRRNCSAINENANQHLIALDGVNWQVVLIPGTQNFDNLPILKRRDDFYDINNRMADYLKNEGVRIDQKNISSPTMAAYLTLQATRLYNHKQPLDSQNPYQFCILDYGQYCPNNDYWFPIGQWRPSLSKRCGQTKLQMNHYHDFYCYYVVSMRPSIYG